MVMKKGIAKATTAAVEAIKSQLQEGQRLRHIARVGTGVLQRRDRGQADRRGHGEGPTTAVITVEESKTA